MSSELARSASALEPCALSLLTPTLLLASCYHLDPASGVKTGALTLHEIAPSSLPLLLSVPATGAVFDTLVRPATTNSPPQLASVTSGGVVELRSFHLHGDAPPTLTPEVCTSLPDTPGGGVVAALGGCWDGDTLAVSDAGGRLTLLSLSPTGLVAGRCWGGHNLGGCGVEAWVVTCNPHSPGVLWSGGDDGALRGWDTRGASRTFVDASTHGAGVTSVAWHPTRPNLVVTGSYDESVRLWDDRQMAAPLEAFPTGGGVWRLAWHPGGGDATTTPLLAACMFGGVRVLNVAHDGHPAIIPHRHFTGHTSLAYGAVWAGEGGRDDRVASCGFYDKSIVVWG